MVRQTKFRAGIFLSILVVYVLFSPAIDFARGDEAKIQKQIKELQGQILSLQNVCATEPADENFYGPAQQPKKDDLALYKNNLVQELNRSDKDVAAVYKHAGLRKAALKRMLRENPEAVLDAFLSDFELTELSKLTSGCAELFAEFEGKLEVFHADYFNESFSETNYFLITDTGRRLGLHAAYGFKDKLESGMRVRVSGFLIDNELVFDGTKSVEQNENSKSGIDVLKTPGNPPVVGDQKTVVLLVNFNDTTQPWFGTSTANSVVFGDVNNYYKENSYDIVSLSGESYGWYQMNIGHNCDGLGVVKDAAIQVADPYVNFAQYSRLIFVAPFSCSWVGLGTIGKINNTTNDGVVSMSVSAIDDNYFNMALTGHEVGHNFGNHHAMFYSCGSTSLTPPCSDYEYGDIYSIMGSGNTGHFNAMHKEDSGWLATSTFVTPTLDGVYSIDPIEATSTNPKGLRIIRGNLASDYLYFEYRQPIGYDSTIGSGNNVYDGALVHTRLSVKSRLIESTPPGDATSAVLLPGQSIVDPNSGTRVTVLSASSTMTFDVDLGKIDFTGPTVTITKPVGNTATSGVILLEAAASDPSGIKQVEFYYILQGVGAQLISTDTVAPYQAYLDTRILPNGFRAVYAKAVDLAGEPYGLPNNISQSGSKLINVANSILSVTPSSLVFSAEYGGSNPPAQQFIVKNTGAGTFSWTASTSVSWLSVTPDSGTGTTTVNANVSISGLSAGVYNGTITVNAPTASSSPKVIPVTLYVSASASPLATYGFSEGSGISTADVSGNGNTGTLFNMVSGDWVSGQTGHGTALNFDNVDNIVDAGSASALDNLSAVTASAWVYARPNQSGYIAGTVLAKAYAVSGYGWDLSDDGYGLGRLRFYADYTGNDLYVSAATGNALPANQWSHVAVTWDGSTDANNVHIYINGTEVNYLTRTNATGTRVDDAPYGFKIGDGHSTYHSTWSGYIDDVRLYGQVLTQPQIQSDRDTPVQ